MAEEHQQQSSQVHIALTSLMEEWTADSAVDEDSLDRESLNQGKLHAKWLNKMTNYKMAAIAIKSRIDKTRGILTRYYNGYMTKPELEAIGREQYRHKQPLKTELERLISADPMFSELEQKYDINLVFAEYCEEVIRAIKNRGFDIKNAGDWRKFIAGA